MSVFKRVHHGDTKRNPRNLKNMYDDSSYGEIDTLENPCLAPRELMLRNV